MKLYASLPFLVVAAVSLAESPNERQLKEIQAQRENAIARALTAIEEKYAADLEVMLRQTIKDQDVATTDKVLQALESAGADSATRSPADTLPGRWLFRSEDWYGERRLLPDGSVHAGVDGLGTWTVVENELRVDYPNGAAAIFALPVRHGKLTGKTKRGIEITAEKLVKR